MFAGKNLFAAVRESLEEAKRVRREVYEKEAEALTGKGNEMRIIEISRKHIKDDPDYISASFNLGMALTQLKNDKEAEEVWGRVIDVESWPSIWKYFRYVAIQGNEETLKEGSVVNCRVRAAMFYKLEFSVLIKEIIPFVKLTVTCSGDLEGDGTWLLNSDGGSVESLFEWNVTTDNMLLKFVEMLPFGRRVLQFNHKIVMEEGYRSFLRS